MKQQRILLALFLLALVLSACQPGHVGTNLIGFIRDGQLWTVDPDGANAFAIVTQSTPVVGYSWSPDHRLVAFRTFDATKSSGRPSSNSITGNISDAPGNLNAIGVDGGTPIILAATSSDVGYSNAIWNSSGTRLLYRQTPLPPPQNPVNVIWALSQSDQPEGIASRTLPGSYAIPSINPSSMQVLGTNQNGLYTTTLNGNDPAYLRNQQPVGQPLPAYLERVLWQPAHQSASFLYAQVAPSAKPTTRGLQFQLLLRTATGQVRPLASCACQQFAWSPDGNFVLYSVGATYSVVRIQDLHTFTIPAAADSAPYWSPNSQFLLLDGTHTLQLTNLKTEQTQTLLSDGGQDSSPISRSLAINTLLQPAANSPWSNDGTQFLFLTRSRSQWQATHLSNGLYTATLTPQGAISGKPLLIDAGKDSQPGWTYQVPESSFLY